MTEKAKSKGEKESLARAAWAATALAATTENTSLASASTAKQLLEKQAVFTIGGWLEQQVQEANSTAFGPRWLAATTHLVFEPLRQQRTGHHHGLVKTSTRTERGAYCSSRHVLPCEKHCGDFASPRNTSPD
ncbi:hypothetical protein MRX96_057621 [Rhipicephalus microplus]